jgi:hypothetical protein
MVFRNINEKFLVAVRTFHFFSPSSKIPNDITNAIIDVRNPIVK